LISGAGDNSIKIFDLETKKQVHHFVEAQEEPMASKIVVSKNGKWIVCACEDNSVKLFDIETKQQVNHILDAHPEKIHAIAISPDNKYFVSGSQDRSIQIFETQNDKEAANSINYAHDSIE